MSLSAPVRDEMVERGAIALLSRWGFGFYTDPMEGGQDAYDLSLEALNDARAVLEATASQVEAGEVVTDAMIEAGLKAYAEPIIADTRDEMNRKWFTAIYKAMRAAQ